MPTRFFVSRQSISYPIPARGLTLPPRREIALDCLDGIAEEPESRLPRAERGVDGAPGGAGVQRSLLAHQ